MLTETGSLFPGLPFISQYFTVTSNKSEGLSAAEASIIARAVPRRQDDFSTGRFCAREALALAINHRPEILKGAGGEPLWPEGITGSISHTQILTGAVVASKARVEAVGLDIETIGGVEPALWSLVFHPSEQELILTGDRPQPIHATLLFSLKESFYKTQYPTTGLVLEFKDILVRETGGRFCIEPVLKNAKLSLIDFERIKTTWTIVADQLVTLCYIPAL